MNDLERFIASQAPWIVIAVGALAMLAWSLERLS
jgi:hypothetical protein